MDNHYFGAGLWVITTALLATHLLGLAAPPVMAMLLSSSAVQFTTETPTTAAEFGTLTATPGGTIESTTLTTPTAMIETAPATVTSTLESTVIPTLSSGQPGKVDLDKFLAPGRGRDLLVENCGGCHTFVCAVIGQRTVGRWENLKLAHRRRVAALSDEDLNLLFAYLEANYNDAKPQPELPPELQGLGCNSGVR